MNWRPLHRKANPVPEYPEDPRINYVIINTKKSVIERGSVKMSEIMTVLDAYPPYAGLTVQFSQAEKNE